jgi:hypothetical protein
MNDSKLRSRFHQAIGEDPMPTQLSSQTRAAVKQQIDAPRTGPQRFAGAVAVVLSIAIVAGLLAVGEYRRSHSGPQTTPAHAAPPSLVYYSGSSSWQAVDWNGHLHGTVGSDRFGLPYQSPDGSRILASPQGVSQIVDSKGTVLSMPDLSRSRGVTWADDSSGLCVLEVVSENPPYGGTYQLVFVPTTGSSRIITSLTTSKGPNVAACSPGAGRIVITTASGYKDPVTELRRITFGELDVVDFKTGAVLHRQAFPIGNRSTEVDWVAVSHDGSLAAMETGPKDSLPSAASPARRSTVETTVVNLLDDRVVIRVSDVTPFAFSWDGKLLVVVGSQYHGEILSVSTGAVVWSDPVNRVTQGAVADPNSSDVMLSVTTGGLNDLLVVSADGKTNVIARNVFQAQIAPCASCSAF